MNAQDRSLFEALNRRHHQLEMSVEQLKVDLDFFRTRLDAIDVPLPPPLVLPPLPMPVAPSLISDVAPAYVAASEFADSSLASMNGSESNIPAIPVRSATPPPVPAEPLHLEFQLGRWLARIGVFFALITLISFSVLVHDAIRTMGPWSKLSVLAVVSGGLIAGGVWLERRNQEMIVYARTLAGGGLACLYYTLYGAAYVEQLRVISSPILGALLLLGWSASVLWLAESRKSELLSVFAIALAYFSSAITPVGGFTMVANLLLALTAAVFLVRNAWAGLSFLCLVGTYAGFLRQIVVNHADNPFDFHFLPVVSFWPLATYLAGAWLIFTASILLARSPEFAHAKRMVFLCLNNGALAGLLLVAAQLAGYAHIGAILGTCGIAFLLCYGLAAWSRADEHDLSGAYLMQGLALATGGIAIAYTGVTRGIVLTLESIFLVAAGAYSRNVILRVGGMVVSLWAAVFLGNEILPSHGDSRWLAAAGALAMLTNGWLARREFWYQPRSEARERWAHESALHAFLAVTLVGCALVNEPARAMGGEFALAALLLTSLVYVLPLFELPPLSQLLLIAGQLLSFGLFHDVNTGSTAFLAQAPWSSNMVAAVTVLLAAWWSRQRQVRTDVWLYVVTALYALALAAFCWEKADLNLGGDAWIMAMPVLSLVFVAFAWWSRQWVFALAGQVLLGAAIYRFLNPDHGFVFVQTSYAAAAPVLVTFATAAIARRLAVKTPQSEWLQIAGRVYHALGTGLLIRWIYGVTPEADLTLALLATATAFIIGGSLGKSSAFIRSGFALDITAALHYGNASTLLQGDQVHTLTWSNFGGIALFLAQPALLRYLSRDHVAKIESWAAIIASSLLGWMFVSDGIAATTSHYMTLAWALYAVVLMVISLASRERRQRWCGLAVLVAAMVRVGVYDFWHLTELYKMLTFLALTVICLGLSFLYYKFGDKVKAWL
jgi:hypothetical protein